MTALAYRLGVLAEWLLHAIAHAGRTTGDIDLWENGNGARI